MISDLVKQYDLSFNILRAQVMEDEEGLMTIEFSGNKQNLNTTIDSLQEQGVQIRELSADIRRNAERCIYCGACVAQCPTGALAMNQTTREIEFDTKKCIMCELCVPACPFAAMKVSHLD
jgi:ferredoxin